MMRTTDRLLSASRGTAPQAIGAANAHGALRFGEVTTYVNEVYRLAPLLGLDASIAVAQSAHETDYWRSDWWVNRLNPAGLGITGDPVENAQSPTFLNGAESAWAQLSHLLVYALGPTDAGSVWFRVTGEPITEADSRYDDYLRAYGNTVQAVTIKALSGTWATDKLYAEGIVSKGNAIYPTLPDQQGGSVSYSTTVPGLPGGPLVTAYPIRQNLVAVDGYQRPGEKARTPRQSIQHGTANPTNQSAWAEAQYFVDGAEGRQASVHSFADDTEVVIGVPLDEIAWQAGDGTGPGNLNGFANEMMEATAIWQNPARRDRMIAIAADFMGRCAARLAAPQPTRHWDWNWGECCDSPCDVQCGDRHHCPNYLMNTGLWDVSYVPQWIAAKNDELARMGGGGPTGMYPEGMDEGIAERLFGKCKGEDGRNYSYNEQGVISQLWLSQGKATGEYPKIYQVWVYADGRKYFVFQGGLTLWQTVETAPPAVLK